MSLLAKVEQELVDRVEQIIEDHLSRQTEDREYVSEAAAREIVTFLLQQFWPNPLQAERQA